MSPRVLSLTLLQRSRGAMRVPAAASATLAAAGSAFGIPLLETTSSVALEGTVQAAANQAASARLGHQLFAPSCLQNLQALVASESSADGSGLAARCAAGEPVVLIAEALLLSAAASDGSQQYVRPVLVDSQVCGMATRWALNVHLAPLICRQCGSLSPHPRRLGRSETLGCRFMTAWYRRRARVSPRSRLLSPLLLGLC